MSDAKGILYVVGIGPGAQDHATPAALKAIAESQLVVGYSTYIVGSPPARRQRDHQDRDDGRDRPRPFRD